MRAALFPGQGVRTADVLEALEASPELAGKTSEVLGYDIVKRVRTAARGTSKVLPTSLAQPAIFTAEVASWKAAEERGERFDFVAGHSLGEYAALVAARSLTFEDALTLVAARGEAMGRVSKTANGGMAAVIGLGLDAVTEMAAAAGVSVANDNAPDQIVVSGGEEGLARIASLAHSNGARTVLLGVEGPYHTKAVAGAALKLAAVLRDTPIVTPRIPAVANVTARPYSHPEEVRDLLIAQVSSPVRWRESIEWLWENGAREFVDMGPGKILAPLVKRTTKPLAGVARG